MTRKTWGNSIGEHYNKNNNPPLPPGNSREVRRESMNNNPPLPPGNDREVRRESNNDGPRNEIGAGNNRRQSHDYIRPLKQLQPLMSFNDFKSRQGNNASIDDIQNRYHEKCILYVNDFSDNFFNNNKKEEWFQDRYNPVNIYYQEEDTKKWAALESEIMFNDLSNSPVEVIKAMCLDFPTSVNEDNNKISITKHEDIDSKGKEVISSSSKVDEVTSIEDINGAHIAGHEKRTIYLSFIHANCQKSAFINTIIDAFIEAQIPAPIRIIISQPIWNKTSKFERNGWVIMPTIESIKDAISIIKNLKFNIHDVTSNCDNSFVELKSISEYYVAAKQSQLSLKTHTTFKMSSSSLRVEYDTIKSIELAAQLDIKRNVPVNTRLEAILDETILPQVKNALVKPTDKLDLAIAYLRRVHFVSYYSCKRFRDESHLLMMSSALLYRCAPYFVSKVRKSLDNGSEIITRNRSDSINNNVVEEDEIRVSKRIRDRDNDEDDDKDDDNDDNERAPFVVEDGEDNKEENDGNNDKNDDNDDLENIRTDSVVVDTDIVVDETSLQIVTKEVKVNSHINIRLEGLIEEIKKEIINENVIDSDNDVMKIIEKQDNAFNKAVDIKCQKEPENKMRCCFTYCNKLFSSNLFLIKHLKTKHVYFASDDLIDVVAPIMKKKYNLENILSRPLPPVEVNGLGHSGVDLIGISDILDKKLIPRILVPLPPGPPPIFQLNQGRVPLPPHPHPNTLDKRNSNNNKEKYEYLPPKEEDNNNRKITSYMDIDAPKESLVNVDYGVVVLPQPKKRKIVKK